MRGARSTPPVGAAADAERFAGLTFDDFRRMAGDDTLSPYERIGFPDAYRRDTEEAILADIVAKLPALHDENQVVMDVGPGCSPLSGMIRDLCEQRGHTLVLVDSPEMLAHHGDGPAVRKVPGRFPECAPALEEWAGRVDALITYSVLQYAFAEGGGTFAFVDAALALLAPGGRLLAGDIPNASMRKRFLASAAGEQHHRAYTGEDRAPAVAFNVLEPGQIDDAVVLGLVARARAAGFDAWIMPQPAGLPMANRREDLVIGRP